MEKEYTPSKTEARTKEPSGMGSSTVQDNYSIRLTISLSRATLLMEKQKGTTLASAMETAVHTKERLRIICVRVKDSMSSRMVRT